MSRVSKGEAEDDDGSEAVAAPSQHGGESNMTSRLLLLLPQPPLFGLPASL